MPPPIPRDVEHAYAELPAHLVAERAELTAGWPRPVRRRAPAAEPSPPDAGQRRTAVGKTDMVKA